MRAIRHDKILYSITDSPCRCKEKKPDDDENRFFSVRKRRLSKKWYTFAYICVILSCNDRPADGSDAEHTRCYDRISPESSGLSGQINTGLRGDLRRQPAAVSSGGATASARSGIPPHQANTSHTRKGCRTSSLPGDSGPGRSTEGIFGTASCCALLCCGLLALPCAGIPPYTYPKGVFYGRKTEDHPPWRSR